jgi:hypothetical protein
MSRTLLAESVYVVQQVGRGLVGVRFGRFRGPARVSVCKRHLAAAFLAFLPPPVFANGNQVRSGRRREYQPVVHDFLEKQDHGVLEQVLRIFLPSLPFLHVVQHDRVRAGVQVF